MRRSLILIAALMLSGCGAQEFFFNKDISLTPGQGQMSDIKQRGVFVQSRPDRDGLMSPVVCAEPSPDAMAAVAASMAASAASGGNDGTSASMSGAVSESAAFVGLRTQTIQLLRDGFYRMCEGYMSGALTPEDFSTMQRRYQANMLALLAIEQLTGTVKSPAIATNTATAAIAQAQIKELSAAIEVEKKRTPPGDTKTLQDQVDVWMEVLAKSQTSTVIVPDGPQQAQASEKVVTAVQAIVQSVVEQDNSGQMCFEYFRSDKSKDPGNPLTPFCVTVLKNITNGQARKVEAMDDCYSKALGIADPAQRERAIKSCQYMISPSRK